MQTVVRAADAPSKRRRRSRYNHHTGVPLRPGQRHPNREESDAAHRAQFGPLAGLFPIAPCYEITPRRAKSWLTGWQVGAYEGASLGALINDPFGLLISDVICWSGMHARGETRQPLHDYLRVSRAEFGILARWMLEAVELGVLDASQLPASLMQPDPEDTDMDYRNRALLALLPHLSPEQLAALNVGDFDLDTASVTVDGRAIHVGDEARYLVDSYLDRRPELEERAPLFLSRSGGRLSVRQVREIAASVRG